jgi:hypothetical protein
MRYRAQRRRDIFRDMAIDLADEAQRKVQQIVILPSCSRHIGRQAEQRFAHLRRRTEGDEKSVHGRGSPCGQRFLHLMSRNVTVTQAASTRFNA